MAFAWDFSGAKSGPAWGVAAASSCWSCLKGSAKPSVFWHLRSDGSDVFGFEKNKHEKRKHPGFKNPLRSFINMGWVFLGQILEDFFNV